jgi:uncharacterized protein (TIGR02186 family)
MMRSISILLIIIMLAATAQAKPLLSDISPNRIDLHASFRGSELLVFGARNEPGDIVIVVRGPTSDITVREKQRIAGMWMFARSAKYNALPQFMGIASTTDISSLQTLDSAQLLRLTPKISIHSSAADPEIDPAFDAAILRVMTEQHLYKTSPEPIRFFGETLFKTRFHFPDTMPRGAYQIESYLFQDDRLVSTQIMPLIADKIGFEAWLSGFAINYPLPYGILCVLVALICGWFAHRVFRAR